jgi:hypothetical protein
MRRASRPSLGIALTAGGAAVLLISMFLPRARVDSYEDFFLSYYDSNVPLSIHKLPTVDAWFFPGPAAGTLLCALLALAVSEAVALRPDLLARVRVPAIVLAALLGLWAVATTVWFPNLAADPAFTRRPAVWLSLGAALVTGAGLLVISAARPPRGMSR